MASARSSDPLALPARDAESLLREPGDMELLGVLRNSSNYTFLARLETSSGEVLGVYKPARGESPLWDFPAETLYLREVAAYRLAQALGWPRVPPTVVREDAPHGIGSVQLFVDADRARNFLTGREDGHPAWPAIAVFDVIANNADRKGGHCLFDHDGGVWAIDHGLTFNAEPKLRTVIWDFAGQPLPRELRGGVERVEAELDRSGVPELLAEDEVEALRRRLRRVLNPRWRLPSPTSGWSVPWPPV